MVFAFVAFGVLRLASRRKRLVVFLVGETLTLNAASSGFYHATEDGPSPVAETDSHGQTRTILLQPDWENFVDPSTIVKQTMPNCDCAATSQIQLVISVGATGISSSSDSWHLQTMDQTGRLKTTGGDEFYVRFEWHRDDVTTKVVDSDRRGSRRRPNRRRKNVETTAVARITDWRNGTYGLAFVTTPLNTYLPYKNTSGHGIFHASQQKGTLTVDLQYTCGMGRMDPPLKDHNRTDQCGSLQKTSGKPSKKNLVFRGKGIFQELNTSRVVEYLEQLDSIYGADLSRAYSSNFSFSSSTTALLLGSAAWDLLQPSNINGTHWGDEDWVDHSNAIRIVIEHVRINYPIVDVYWKSPAALHVHRVDRNNAAATDRARYMAASRSRRLYEVQKQLLQSLGVPFLDVYEAFYLSGDWCFDEDGRHYAVWLNYVVLGWFFGKDERSGQLEMI